MINTIAKLLYRYLSEPEALFLFFFLIITVIILTVMGNIMVPIIASIIIAYMLNGFVTRLKHRKLPHILAVTVVYLLFLGIFLLFFIWLLPLLFQQLSNLFSEIPKMLGKGQAFFSTLQQQYPDILSAERIDRWTNELNNYLSQFGHLVLSYSISSIGNIITAIVYLILVPLLVFFFLKDAKAINHWISRFFPKNRPILRKMWKEIDSKIGDYIRGKIIEMIIVTIASIIAFEIMGLDYAILLAVGVGVGVVIPYVGAILITIPVVAIAFLQWGWSSYFAYLLLIYTIINLLDANILIPLLFSERMKLHPIAIILAVLVFGDLWGFWGIFFSIPLAMVVNTLIKDWPRKISKT